MPPQGPQPPGETADAQPRLPKYVFQQAVVRLNIAGALGNAFATLTNGIFRVGFFRRLGANDFHIGLLTAIPPLTNTMQLFSAYLAEKLGDRRKVSLLSFSAGRLLWIPIVLIPYTVARVRPNLVIPLMLGLLVSYNLLTALGASAWYSWVADVVPEERRSKFFGNRYTMLTIVAMVCALLASRVADLFPGHSEFAGFAIIFGVGICLGQLDLWIHRKVPHPSMDRSTRSMSFKQLMREPWGRPEFRRFLASSLLYYIGAYFTAGLGQIYLLETLNLNFFSITLLGMVMSLSTAAFYQMWGNIGKKIGQRTVMTICLSTGVLLGPVYFFLSPEWCFPPLALVYMMSGMVSAGMSLATNTILFDLFPRKGKSIYMAQYFWIIGAAGAVSSTLGGALGYRLGSALKGATFCGNPLTNFHILLLVSMSCRAIAVVLLQRVPDTKAVSPVFLMTQILTTNPMRLAGGILRFGVATTEKARMATTRSLGATKSRLVVEELVAALDDPSSEVREHAVESLGEIGGDEAAAALLERATDEHSGLQALAVRALGKTGDRSAVPELIALLKHEEPSIRSAAASALGKIGDPDAAAALLEQMEGEESGHALAASAEALGKQGELQAIWTILPALRETENPALRRQLSISIGNILGQEGEFYRIFNQESKTHGRSVSRIVRHLTAKRTLEGLRLADEHAASQFADAVREAREAYLTENWRQTIQLLAEPAHCLIAQFLMERGRIYTTPNGGRDRAGLDLVTDAGVLFDERLGSDIWFMAHMLEEPDPTWEEAVLAFYGFRCLVDHLTAARVTEAEQPQLQLQT